MGKTKLLQGMLLGAIAGGALSLFDKETRRAVLETSRKTAGSAAYYIKNPSKAVESVKQTAGSIRTTIEQVTEDVAFITEKVEELREVTPQVVDIVQETRSAFSKESKKAALAEDEPLKKTSGISTEEE
ncbi:YtxH domain-containing protein [Bacillus infantis]|uniref:YtxH domain-containing protein n=1 Tax=Bacillus infantis TaxID=324767 RepID=UPI0020A02B91|nr:YtxH domain-containing protein [Bacillus infantis]MCP1156952.1 YtxH domain-containing protein [Bacillus infantis]